MNLLLLKKASAKVNILFESTNKIPVFFTKTFFEVVLLTPAPLHFGEGRRLSVIEGRHCHCGLACAIAGACAVIAGLTRNPLIDVKHLSPVFLHCSLFIINY
jgi:hypothetical protein